MNEERSFSLHNAEQQQQQQRAVIEVVRYDCESSSVSPPEHETESKSKTTETSKSHRFEYKMAYVKESAMQVMNEIMKDPKFYERTMDMPFRFKGEFFYSFSRKSKTNDD